MCGESVVNSFGAGGAGGGQVGLLLIVCTTEKWSVVAVVVLNYEQHFLELFSDFSDALLALLSFLIVCDRTD